MPNFMRETAMEERKYTPYEDRIMLRIEHLTKRYGAKTAVNDLSLHVLPGEICAFVGHNGAGKSTTLRSIAGIQPFDSGEIFIDRLSIRLEGISCKQITAYIPDEPILYEYMTGTQYLNFIADIFHISAEERKKQIPYYTDLFKISQESTQLIGAYSHGTKQKLVLASAFIHNPRLIIMDEPFVGLDPVAGHSLKCLMRSFCDNGGTIFFSTHVLSVAQALCDKVAIIQNGELVRFGSMNDVIGNSSLENVFLNLQEGEK